MVSDSTAADRPRHWWTELPKRRLLGACAAAFAAGTPQRAYLLRLGMPAARIRLGCDVVDNQHFADGAARARGDAEAVRCRLGLPLRYFLCAGRLVANKDPGLVLDAFAALLKRRPRTPEHLVFAGDGPLRPMLEAARQRLGLGARVHLPGFAAYADLPALYGLASAAVVASRCCEPWGLVINEAMAAGLPVLVSRACGAAADLVQEGCNGWTFAPGDADGLAALMARVVDDPPAAARLGANGAALIQAWSPAGFAREALALADIARAAPPRRARGAAALARVLAEVQRHV
jgi:glycosyltransferase involved in cell wall biosynthesis